MELINRILAVVNLQAERQLVLERAARLAGSNGAELRLQAVVYEPELADGIFYWDDDDHEAERKALLASAEEQLEKRAAALDLTRVSVGADWGHPLDQAVLPLVADYGPDVLIVQPRAGAGGRLSLTEWRLLRQCPAPVWLARAGNWPETPTVAAAVDPADGDDERASLDREIIGAADVMSRAFGSGFAVLHSIGGIPSVIGVAQSPADYERELREIRSRRIGKLLPTDSKDRIEVVLSNLEPARALRDHCIEREVDLLVMGMLARSRLAERLVGSTVRRFVPRSGCDLLLIKPS